MQSGNGAGGLSSGNKNVVAIRENFCFSQNAEPQRKMEAHLKRTLLPEEYLDHTNRRMSMIPLQTYRSAYPAFNGPRYSRNFRTLPSANFCLGKQTVVDTWYQRVGVGDNYEVVRRATKLHGGDDRLVFMHHHRTSPALTITVNVRKSADWRAIEDEDATRDAYGPRCLRCGAERALVLRDCCGYAECESCDSKFASIWCDYCNRCIPYCPCNIIEIVDVFEPHLCPCCLRLSCGDPDHSVLSKPKSTTTVFGASTHERAIQKRRNAARVRRAQTSSVCASCKVHFCSLCNPMNDRKILSCVACKGEKWCLCGTYAENDRSEGLHCARHPLFCDKCRETKCRYCEKCRLWIYGCEKESHCDDACKRAPELV
jgi:hypothetical protein